MPEYIQKLTRIPKEDAEWFEENYPNRGAWTWLIQNTLQKFRELHYNDSPNQILESAVREVKNKGR